MLSIFKKISNNLDLTFFYLFILSIPLGTKLVFLSKDSYFTGAFVHYTTFFLYLSDIFFILALFFWILRKARNRYSKQNIKNCHSELVSESEKLLVNSINRFRNKFGMTKSMLKIITLRKRHSGMSFSNSRENSIKSEASSNTYKMPSKQNIIYYILFFFLICAVLSIFLAKNNLIGIYQVLKLSEFILLFILAGKLINSLKKLYFCFILILSTGFTQAVISVAQYYKQGSLGLKWLGEPILSPDLAGVAKIVVDGEKIIRAYGTFSHPNVLAGFLLMSLFISFYFLFFYINNRRRYDVVSPSVKKPNLSFLTQNWRFSFLITLISVQFLAFILTFSRTAWLASLFSLFCFIIYYLTLTISFKKLKDKAFLKRGLFERSEFRPSATLAMRAGSKKMSYFSVIIQRLSCFLKNLLKFSFKIVSRETILFFRLNKAKFASLIIIILIISCFSIMLSPQISTRFEINKNDQAFSDRFLFNSFALEIIKKSPFLGVGMGNFVLNVDQIKKTSSIYSLMCILSESCHPELVSGSINSIKQSNKQILKQVQNDKEKFKDIKRGFSLESWQYQPVHNFYLLIAAEIGIIGLILFILFIFKVLKMAYLKVKSQIVSRETIFTRHINLCVGCLLTIFLGFLFIGFFDHYFWTIQQGQLIFWLILGLLMASCKINETC